MIERLLVEKAWNKVNVPFNKEAYFYQYAKMYKLGMPASTEYSITVNRRNYRCQAFIGGIVFAEVVNGQVQTATTNHVDWL